MIFILLFLLCSVNSEGSKEGEHCSTKEGVAGVCTNIGLCPAALQDIKNRKEPQICEFNREPIVCCIPSVTTTSTPSTTTITTISARSTGKCVLPPYPKHGTYNTNVLNGKPGDAYDFVVINTTCRDSFVVSGSRSVFCHDGWWTEPMPNCVPACHLLPHPSVEYYCIVSDGRVNGTRVCEKYEPHDTFVSPRCRSPHFSSPTKLDLMRCANGSWNYIAKCNPDCGILIEEAPRGNGTKAKRMEVPWHAGIYTKTTRPYKYVCGGSLISTKIILSAAHCFWNYIDGKLPESSYAVSVGEWYRPWTDPYELNQAQYSEVNKIHLPELFQGSADNIAVVITGAPFELTSHVWPVCLDFNTTLENQQLQSGNEGKIASWGLTSKNDNASQVLKLNKVLYTTIETCIAKSPFVFRKYISGDKICTGNDDESIPLCKGDSGAGLVFPQAAEDKMRYYLRGIVAIAFNSKTSCNTAPYKFFTQVSKHEDFIKRFWGTPE